MDADFQAEVRAAIAQVRGDNEQQIAFRRGTTTLAAQAVRVERKSASQSQERDSEGGQEMRARVVVLGGVDLDIRVGDNFNDAAGTLYRVVFVRPNRMVSTQAEAEVIE